MRLVIDIPDTAYEGIIRANNANGTWGDDLLGVLCKGVANGIPLPKEHLDLIERDDVDILLPCFGTDDWIRDQMKEAKIDYLYNDDEDKVFEFGKRLVKGFMNVVDTATTIIPANKEE